MLLRSVALTVGICGSLLRAQPFNPYTLHYPVDTGRLTGSLVDSNYPTNNPFRKHSPENFEFSLTYFPIEDGSVKPLADGNLSPETIPSPPQEAAPFFSEPFYPHLTTLLIHEQLTGAMRGRLENYRRARDQAAMGIEQRLDQLRNFPSQDAAAFWQEYASKEKSIWAKIEKKKLSILNKLQNGGIWTRGVGIEEFPYLRRHFSVAQIKDDRIKLRALRHFAPHLSLDQRDLIGEILAEVTAAEQTGSEDLFLQISPDGKHLDLPTDPKPAFVQALSAYQKTKQELKQDLLQTLVPSVWGLANNRELVTKMKKLRKQQAPQFQILAQQLKAVAVALEQSESKPNNESTESPAIMATSHSLSPATLTLLASPERRLLASANPGS